MTAPGLRWVWARLIKRTWLTALVLVLLLARLAIPAGYMPGAAATDHGLALSLCSGVTVQALASDETPSSHEDDGGTAACPFAIALATAMMPSGVAPSSLAAFPPMTSALRPDAAPPVATAAGPPLGSRAPPPA